MGTKRRPVVHSSDVLCCCEYTDAKGDRSHIMASCCDCEALDKACDRCVTCRGIPPEVCEAVSLTCLDRWRLPWCSGKGAIRVDPELGVPLVTIPSAIFLATINGVMTVLMMTVIPVIILTRYHTWMRRQNKPRTKLFYMCGLVSVWLMMFIFLFVVTGFRKILLWEILLLVTVFILMNYALYHAKKDPGSIPKMNLYPSSVCDIARYPPKDLGSKQPQGEAGMTSANEEAIAEAKQLLITNFGLHEYVDNMEEKSQEMKRIDENSLDEDLVTWADSRPIERGRLIMWCKDCHIHRPPRSGHCPVCGTCIKGRDHHCVWIDNCIGANNHRAFITSLVLFIFGGYYGSHLTLTTICTPTMFLDWFLIPNDCRFVYADFPTALAFVGCIYSLIASTGMLFVLLNQVLLISQNATSQEVHNASQRSWAQGLALGRFTCPCCISHNVNNRGIIRNWKDFISGARKNANTYGPQVV